MYFAVRGGGGGEEGVLLKYGGQQGEIVRNPSSEVISRQSAIDLSIGH